MPKVYRVSLPNTQESIAALFKSSCWRHLRAFLRLLMGLYRSIEHVQDSRYILDLNLLDRPLLRLFRRLIKDPAQEERQILVLLAGVDQLAPDAIGLKLVDHGRGCLSVHVRLGDGEIENSGNENASGVASRTDCRLDRCLVRVALWPNIVEREFPFIPFLMAAGVFHVGENLPAVRSRGRGLAEGQAEPVPGVDRLRQ